ncbi:RNA-binding protein [Chryseobacterium mulctrae]|uniref:hypothetical protein n=1 Tax=Chryseobacterium mulctrae TaxID=2576777 RepID=UPI001E511284|nr:hypothetical protein [Chryseobacterium mulctrae]
MNFNKYNNLSFTYSCKGDSIFIRPYFTKTVSDLNISQNMKEQTVSTRRLHYFRKRYGLKESEMQQFSYQYRNIAQTRELIEKDFTEFIRLNRLKKIKSTEFQGMAFLSEIQEIIIKLYKETKMGALLPNGYPVIR